MLFLCEASKIKIAVVKSVTSNLQVKFKVAQFARCCLGRHFSTWHMIAASCPTAVSALWSADVPTCVVPRTLSSYGYRTFAAAGPCLWNSLLIQLCNPDITSDIRRQLKGHLFRDAWTRRSVTSDMRRLRKKLTYLLTSRLTGFALFYSHPMNWVNFAMTLSWRQDHKHCLTY